MCAVVISKHVLNHSMTCCDPHHMCLSPAEHRVSVPYSIDQRCGTKAELPDLTPDEFDAIAEADRLNPDRIEQVCNAVDGCVSP